MNKKFIIGLSLLAIGTLQAQKSEQYLHFNIGGGSNSLNYQIKDGTQKGAAGYTINAAYSYFFNEHWGLQSGIGVQSFGSQSTLNLLTTEPAVDATGESYELSTKYNNLKEKQQVLSIEIPVVGQYKYAFNSQWGLIASAGAKISIPAYKAFKTTGGDITTTGYYSQWNMVLYDLPQHGFFTTNDTYQGKLAVKPAYMAVADLGGLYKVSKKIDLYLGGYFSYGLNNILTPDSKHIFLQDRTYNGILASTQTNKVIPVSVGVKIGIYWQQGEK